MMLWPLLVLGLLHQLVLLFHYLFYTSPCSSLLLHYSYECLDQLWWVNLLFQGNPKFSMSPWPLRATNRIIDIPILVRITCWCKGGTSLLFNRLPSSGTINKLSWPSNISLSTIPNHLILYQSIFTFIIITKSQLLQIKRKTWLTNIWTYYTHPAMGSPTYSH